MGWDWRGEWIRRDLGVGKGVKREWAIKRKTTGDASDALVSGLVF